MKKKRTTILIMIFYTILFIMLGIKLLGLTIENRKVVINSNFLRDIKEYSDVKPVKKISENTLLIQNIGKRKIFKLSNKENNLIGSSFVFTAEADKIRVQPGGDVVTIDVSVSDINVGEHGMNVIEGYLYYDTKFYTNIELINLNDWKITYNNENGKFLMVKMVDGIHEEEKICQIKLTINEDLTEGQGTISLKEIQSNDGEKLIGQEDRTITVKLKQSNTPDAWDTDGDGKPDAWDTDKDGKPDAWDTDGDGKPDAWDTDKDGKPDAWDTDGDGKADSWDENGNGELDDEENNSKNGGDGRDKNGGKDTTGDGKVDAWDTDRDGKDDIWDTDGDGKPDAWDTDKDGKPDAWDTDKDGKPDAWDTDKDGKPDAWDTDKDGKPDVWDTKEDGTQDDSTTPNTPDESIKPGQSSNSNSSNNPSNSKDANLNDSKNTENQITQNNRVNSEPNSTQNIKAGDKIVLVFGTIIFVIIINFIISAFEKKD